MSMLKHKLAVAASIVGLGALLAIPSLAAPKAKPAVKAAADNRETCYACHSEVKALKEKSKHAAIACSVCHDKTAEHLANPGRDTKPITKIDQAVCGSCHKNQHDSYFAVHHDPTGARKDKGIPTGRSPMQDKLLAPHGFTFEHAEPRSHAYMAIDQFAVDRFQGGRYQFKGGWKNYDKVGKVWDVLEDKGASYKLTETAMAGNPTCIQCKSSDLILKWKHLGEKDPRAKFSRSSNVNDVVKDVHNSMGCIHCHDPHGAQPRIVRDALIEAIEKDPAKNIFAKNGKTDLKVISFRDGFRKIGIMEKADSRMMCAQCHVEYVCNPGTQQSDGKPVTFADPRTNYYPLKNALESLEHYRKIDFFDFKHAITGARLIKFQHPEAETYAGSAHDKAGVQCHQCHMPQAKAKKGGKGYTSHNAIKPIQHVKESCINCHKDYTPDKAKYMIETIRNYTKGKMRKAEYWLGQLIDTFAVAQREGVVPTVLDQARLKHEEAHALWEYWTAENSDGFHNPEQARQSLTGSIAASKAAVKMLNDAIMVAKQPKKEEVKK